MLFAELTYLICNYFTVLRHTTYAFGVEFVVENKRFIIHQISNQYYYIDFIDKFGSVELSISDIKEDDLINVLNKYL